MKNIKYVLPPLAGAVAGALIGSALAFVLTGYADASGVPVNGNPFWVVPYASLAGLCLGTVYIVLTGAQDLWEHLDKK